MIETFEINRETITIRFIEDMKKNDYDEIIRIYRDTNKPVIHIMKRFNITKSAVYKILEDSNYVKRSKKFNRVTELINTYNSNNSSISSIANHFKISTRSINKILKENNIPKRKDLRYSK